MPMSCALEVDLESGGVDAKSPKCLETQVSLRHLSLGPFQHGHTLRFREFSITNN